MQTHNQRYDSTAVYHIKRMKEIQVDGNKFSKKDLVFKLIFEVNEYFHYKYVVVNRLKIHK